MSIEETLKSSVLFKDFSDTGIQILASVAAEKRFPQGSPLFTENMVGDGLFIIQEGKVSVVLKGPDGKDQPLATLGKGENLGELSLLSASTRLVTAVAETAVTAVEIRSESFKKLLAQKPQACIKLMLNISSEFGKKLAGNRDALRALATAR